MRPRDAVVTLYGGYLRGLGNWVAIADLVVLLDQLGIDEQSARSAIARLKRTGLLVAARHHGAAGYSAGPQLLEILADGDVRIFQSQLAANLADGWVLVIFSVPETERDRRHQLRAKLSALGCGPLAAGVWMAPRRVAGDVRRMLARTDLARYASLFEGSYGGFRELDALVLNTWNVTPLARQYAQFRTRTQRVLTRWERSPGDHQAAFVRYTGLLETWREVAYHDPGLPDEVSACAADRRAARDVFVAATEMLRAPATAHVAEMMGARRLAGGPSPISDTGRGR